MIITVVLACSLLPRFFFRSGSYFLRKKILSEKKIYLCICWRKLHFFQLSLFSCVDKRDFQWWQWQEKTRMTRKRLDCNHILLFRKEKRLKKQEWRKCRTLFLFLNTFFYFFSPFLEPILKNTSAIEASHVIELIFHYKKYHIIRTPQHKKMDTGPII